ncbi:hypothetical protein [Porphyromonas pogonae]|uniref:hypothetical protein n=1 Tax=Porphyromonas pogonae TaxID=867595 RepID=UPI002E76C929|nr:hypothetical protein [Porphyromonas pogonae]
MNHKLTPLDEGFAVRHQCQDISSPIQLHHNHTQAFLKTTLSGQIRAGEHS